MQLKIHLILLCSMLSVTTPPHYKLKVFLHSLFYEDCATVLKRKRHLTSI